MMRKSLFLFLAFRWFPSVSKFLSYDESYYFGFSLSLSCALILMKVLCVFFPKIVVAFFECRFFVCHFFTCSSLFWYTFFSLSIDFDMGNVGSVGQHERISSAVATTTDTSSNISGPLQNGEKKEKSWTKKKKENALALKRKYYDVILFVQVYWNIELMEFNMLDHR